MNISPMIHKSTLIAVSLALIFVTVALAASGDLDTTFSSDGKIVQGFGGLQHTATDLAVQPDGKLVVVGEKYTAAGRDFAIARYNINGSLDTTFSGDGKRVVNIGEIDQAKSVVIQGDGKIVVGGQSCNELFTTCKVTLVRLNPNGSLDTSFSGDGKVTTLFGGGNNRANDIALQNGKIVVVGSAHDGSSFNGAVLRYLSNGTLDTTFSGDGIMTIIYGGHEYLTAVAIYSGKIYVGGYSSSLNYDNADFIAARINNNGTLDTSFNGIGKAKTDLGGYDSAQDLVVTSTGRVILAGDSSNKLAVVQYMPGGTPDGTFSGDGKLTEYLGYFSISIMDVAIRSGRIVLVGGADNTNAVVIRLTSDGSLDTTFSTDGIANTDWGGGADIYMSAVYRSSRLYVAGISITPMEVSRFVVAAYIP